MELQDVSFRYAQSHPYVEYWRFSRALLKLGRGRLIGEQLHVYCSSVYSNDMMHGSSLVCIDEKSFIGL